MKKIIIALLLAVFVSGCALYVPRPAHVVAYSYDYVKPAIVIAPSTTVVHTPRRVVYRSGPVYKRYIKKNYYHDRVIIKNHHHSTRVVNKHHHYKTKVKSKNVYHSHAYKKKIKKTKSYKNYKKKKNKYKKRR